MFLTLLVSERKEVGFFDQYLQQAFQFNFQLQAFQHSSIQAFKRSNCNVEIWRKFNAYKTLRRRAACLLNVSCTLNLGSVSRGWNSEKTFASRRHVFQNCSLKLSFSLERASRCRNYGGFLIITSKLHILPNKMEKRIMCLNLRDISLCRFCCFKSLFNFLPFSSVFCELLSKLWLHFCYVGYLFPHVIYWRPWGNLVEEKMLKDLYSHLHSSILLWIHSFTLYMIIGRYIKRWKTQSNGEE